MFRTPVSLVPSASPITLNNGVLSIGSCFADFIGEKLAKNKFEILVNPFGIVFHPLAQFRILELALTDALPPKNTYICHQGIWYNFFFHSSIAHTSRVGLEERISQGMEQLKTKIADLEVLMLTFGTAVQYQHLKTGYMVANCHKVPHQEFEKSLTSSETITKEYHQLCTTWGSTMPQVILSVSPIRHLKEGMLLNSASKCTLRVAVEELVKNNSMISYFPGFEIMMDDLRDYRFFESDMIHPNDTAREYIWDLFKENFLDQPARNFIEQWHKIMLNLAHRPFHPQSSTHQEFLQKTLKLIKQLPANIDATLEVASLKKNLK